MVICDEAHRSQYDFIDGYARHMRDALPHLMQPVSPLDGDLDQLPDLLAPADDNRDHIRGRLDATVTVVEYGDFECPFCAGMHEVMRELAASGTDVRVNIVGFAIDDPKLAATFRHWSDLGKGTYFAAKDAAALNDAMARALRQSEAAPAVDIGR
mgnify:CR=1 FL=1